MDTKALRQKILDLAIRGKLVPQDPNDEPASVLLESIRAQKQQMVREGKLKPKDIKDDTVIFVGEDNLHYEKLADGTVKCIEDEIPFDVPKGWSWARIFSIADDLPYGTAKKSDKEGKLVVLRMGNIQSGEIDYKDLVYSSDEEDIARYSLVPGDLLFNRTNSAEWVGKTAIYRGDIPCIYAGYLIRVRTHINAEYLNAVMNSGYAKDYCNSVKTDGVNQSNINAQKLGAFLVPIPPIKEQFRIDAYIAKALPYIQAIAQNKADIATLVSLTKSRILDLAIHGQLVPHNPDDEPASVLLDRIHAEKKDLIKQGIIKQDKRESVIFRGEDNSYYLKQNDHVEAVDSQFLFDLPDGWSWCLIPNIAHSELGKTLDQAKNTGDLRPYLRSVNIRWDEIDISDINQMRFEPEEIERYTITKGDLLICEGGDVGRSAIWNSDNDILYQNALHRVRFWGGINPRFFMYYMMFYESKGIIKDICKGVTIKHLTGNVLNSIPFALPPLDEQRAIVARIDETFNILNSIL